MPPDPHSASARHEWASPARAHLLALTDAVLALRRRFESGVPVDLPTAADLAAEVLAACAALTDWMGGAKAPRGLTRAEGELAAAAGVYRNAAFAFRSLAEAEADQLEPRSVACAAMLEQGDHHVEVFSSSLRRKLE